MKNVRNLLNVEKDTNYSLREASMTSPTLRSASSCPLQRKMGITVVHFREVYTVSKIVKRVQAHYPTTMLQKGRCTLVL